MLTAQREVLFVRLPTSSCPEETYVVRTVVRDFAHKDERTYVPTKLEGIGCPVGARPQLQGASSSKQSS